MIVGFIFLILLVIIYLALSNKDTENELSQQQINNQIDKNIPTNEQLQQEKKQDFIIQAVEPSNGKENVDVKTFITIRYAQPLAQKDIKEIVLSPKMDADFSLKNKTLIIKPKRTLQPGTPYSFRIYYANETYSESFYFVTEGETPEEFYEQVDPGILLDNSEEEQKKNDPSLYVFNKTPYKTELFSVSSNLTSDDTIIIHVTLKTDGEKARQEFIEWLLSIGLTEEQIGELNIEYEIQ